MSAVDAVWCPECKAETMRVPSGLCPWCDGPTLERRPNRRGGKPAGTRRGEQYAGWKQLHSGADDEATVDRGRAIIRDAAGDVVEALKATHPDRGGNPVDFRSVMLAREAG